MGQHFPISRHLSLPQVIFLSNNSIFFPSSPSASDLVEVTETGSSSLAIGPISAPDFRFLEVVPLKTPFPNIAPIAVIPAIPELSTIVFPQQSPPASIALPPIKVDSQDEFIGELMEGFYKSLKRCLPMIFKSTRTSFASWTLIFSRAI